MEVKVMKFELVTSLKHHATRILSEFQQRRMHILKGVAKGERDIRNGCTFSHEEAKDKILKMLD